MNAAVADPDLVFKVGEIPVYFQGAPIMTLRGDWQAGDAQWLAAIARSFRALVDWVLSVDLDFDFAPLMNYILLDKTDFTKAEQDELLYDLLYTLVTDPNYPNFLLLTPEGPWRMPRVGTNLGYAAGYLSGA
ncbi:MAG: hypothetical protein M5R36_03790 [Deltaproteobacteria bacterium]|nr:hypothetical protein [Deltaproteobacteria bacterium]